MTYRVCRHITSSTFTVNGQLCKVFLDPQFEYRPGFWMWNVGFAVGKSRRQLNDWYWKRKNKRWRSLHQQFVGTSGIRTISRGFKEVLKLRWNRTWRCYLLELHLKGSREAIQNLDALGTIKETS